MIHTTAKELTSRTETLPENFREYVKTTSPGVAKVQSFTDPKRFWTVAIREDPERENERLTLCGCPATKICHHIIAFWAVMQDEAAEEAVDEATDKAGQAEPREAGLPLDGISEAKEKGLRLIAEAIEKLVDGIALVVTERMKEEGCDRKC